LDSRRRRRRKVYSRRRRKVYSEEEEEEEEEGLFKANVVGGLRARPRSPGVEDGTRRNTFLRATHRYLSMLGRRRRRTKVYSGVDTVNVNARQCMSY